MSVKSTWTDMHCAYLDDVQILLPLLNQNHGLQKIVQSLQNDTFERGKNGRMIRRRPRMTQYTAHVRTAHVRTSSTIFRIRSWYRFWSWEIAPKRRRASSRIVCEMFEDDWTVRPKKVKRKIRTKMWSSRAFSTFKRAWLRRLELWLKTKFFFFLKKIRGKNQRFFRLRSSKDPGGAYIFFWSSICFSLRS